MRAGWEYKKLGEVCDVLNGLWTGKKEPFLNVAVIRNANFTKECTLDLSNVAYIDVEERQFKSRELKYGDIIIEKSGGSDKQPVGRPVLFDIQENGYSFSNFTATLRIKEETLLSSKFLHKVLLAQYNQGFTRRLQSKTTGLHNLDMKSYLKSVIPLPPIPQQRLIVSELDEINSLIALKRNQLKKYDELAQSLFYEMFGDPVENEKGWEVKKLGEIFEYVKNGANIKQEKGAGGYPITRIETLSGGIFNRDRLGYANITDLSKFEQYILKDNDLLLSHINSKTYIGRTVRYSSLPNEVIIHGMNLLRIKSNESVINSTYFAYYTLTDAFKKCIAKIRKDAVNQSSITVNDLKKIPVPLSPLSLQRLFARRIEQIEEQKKQVTAAIAKLETLLASRMQYWFE